MSRATRERRLEADERWPLLKAFLARALSERIGAEHDSARSALKEAVRLLPAEDRTVLLKEWQDWNSTNGWRNNADCLVRDGLEVPLPFNDDVEARKLMNMVYEHLVIRAAPASEKHQIS